MTWWQKFRRTGAKAKRVQPEGNHIENLKAHHIVDIQQIGETSDVPVWIDVDLSRFSAAPSARLSHLSFEGDRAFPAQC